MAKCKDGHANFCDGPQIANPKILGSFCYHKPGKFLLWASPQMANSKPSKQNSELRACFLPRNDSQQNSKSVPPNLFYRTESRKFSVPRNSWNSIGTNHLFHLFPLLRLPSAELFYFLKFSTLALCLLFFSLQYFFSKTDASRFFLILHSIKFEIFYNFGKWK